jgi:hypothetical protein
MDLIPIGFGAVGLIPVGFSAIGYGCAPQKSSLKVHKIENFFDSDFGICVISLLVMHK